MDYLDNQIYQINQPPLMQPANAATEPSAAQLKVEEITNALCKELLAAIWLLEKNGFRVEPK